MKKKGLWREIGIGILSVIGLVVVLIIFFPHLLGGALAAFFNLLGFVPSPDEEPPEFKGAVQIPPELEQDYDILVNNIKNAKNIGADKCLVYTSELNIPEGWTIRLSENELVLIKLQEGGVNLPKKPVAINGFKPCVIKDVNATNFYNCYLKEGERTCSATIPTPTNVITNVVLGGDEKIKFLYKSGDNFCFFPSYEDGGEMCSSPSQSGAEGIDDDCRYKMPYFENNLLNCDDVGFNPVFQNKESIKLEAQKISGAIQEGLASSADRCLVKYAHLDIPDKDWKIGMMQKDNNIKFVQLNSVGRVGKLDLEIPANLCLVEGNAAQNLDGNVKDGTSLTPEFFSKERFSIGVKSGRYQINVGGPYDVYDEENDGDDDKAYTNIKDDPNYRHLYKADSSHVCFLALKQDSGGGCGGATLGGIDDDCYKEWVNDEELFECSFLDSLNGVFLCDDEHCLDNPPTKPWRRTIIDINSICGVAPSAKDSEPDGNKICGEIGSIRIFGNYDIRLYENTNYGGKKICFKDEGSYKLDDYPIVPNNGWNKDTDSIKIIPDGSCTNPGVTEG